MVRSGAVQDVPNLGDLCVGPFLVERSSVLGDRGEDTQQTEGDDGLLIDDVEFVRDGPDADTGGRGENGGLADEGVAGERVEDRLGLCLWVHRSRGSGGLEADGWGGHGQTGEEGGGGSEACSTCAGFGG